MRIIVSALLIAWLVAGLGHAKELPTAAELIEATPFRDQDIQRILEGETVGTRIDPAPCGEVSVGLVCLMTEDRPALMDAIRSGTWVAPSPDLVDQGFIRPGHAREDLSRLHFGPGDWSELRRYLKARPGTELNLSFQEISRFRALKPTGIRDQDISLVADRLRESLVARYLAYRSKGLEGIPGYARGGERVTEPADELRCSLEGTPAMKDFYPDLYQYLLDYPTTLPTGAAEHFFWGKLYIDDRLGVGLSHRVSTGDADSALLAERAFYISHTLNASQTFLAILPVVEGKLLFYVNRAWIDRVVGLGCPLKTLVARYLVLSEMRKIMANMKVCGSAATGAGHKSPSVPIVETP